MDSSVCKAGPCSLESSNYEKGMIQYKQVPLKRYKFVISVAPERQDIFRGTSSTCITI